MPLSVWGMDHHTAPLAVRERVAVPREALMHHVQCVAQQADLREVALLSTCNRTEFYVHTEDVERLSAHLLGAGPWGESRAHVYHMQAQDAVIHAMRVASGLRSMLLGETQIVGQIKQAYATACAAGTAGPLLKGVFPRVLQAAKQVRTQTCVDQGRWSWSGISCALAEQLFASLSDKRILMVGAGETIQSLAQSFSRRGVRHFVFCNRTVERAAQLAERFGGQAAPMSDVPVHLGAADLTICAASTVVITQAMMQRAQSLQRRRPRMVLDLAVPRNVEPSVAHLRDVYCYDVDSVQTMVQQTTSQRADAAHQAEAIIAAAAQAYHAWWSAQPMWDHIRVARRTAEAIQEAACAKGDMWLAQGMEPGEVLRRVAHEISQKLMHGPTIALKKMAMGEAVQHGVIPAETVSGT